MNQDPLVSVQIVVRDSCRDILGVLDAIRQQATLLSDCKVLLNTLRII